MSLEVDGLTKEFDIIFFWEENTSLNPWSDYFSLDDWRFFALCNITFGGYSNTTIRYSFDSSFYAHSKTGLWLSYDVGTSRAWNGFTTENVEFRVFGRQPDSYSNNSLNPTTKFTLTDIENGKSYLWTWEAVIIEENSVGIGYAFYKHTTETPGYIFLSALFSLIILKNYPKYKKKQKE